jgi:two-component sensor histidine kinase
MASTVLSNSRKRKQLLGHVSIWAVFVFFNLMQPRFDSDLLLNRVIPLQLGNILIFYINYSYLVPEFLLKKKAVLYVLFTVVLIVISAYIFKELAPEPKHTIVFKELVPGSKHTISPPPIPKGKFIHIRLIGPLAFNILLIVTGIALRVYAEWNRNERLKKEIEVQKSATELSFLKNQLNPHFLFNSLNSIYSLTTKKSNDAPEAVITLSELMRYMLYETDNDFVLLKEELEYIQNYIKLQRLRIAKNENVTINIHGSISNQKIRPLLLISFIENAFKYGTDFKGNTEIKIEIHVKEDELQFTCINLIGDRKADKVSSGIGLQNTKDRLELLYPDKHTLLVEEKDDRFIVKLTLKLT